MKDAMQSSQSLELLSKMLTSENIQVRYCSKAPTASFDAVSRIITLPSWDIDRNANLGLAIHEIAHALYTPADLKIRMEQHGIPGAITNIIEDAYIERRIKSKFPGSRNILKKMYQSINDMGLFHANGEQITDEYMQQCNFVDKANLFYKIGHLVDVPLTDEERELVMEGLTVTRPNFKDVALKFKEMIEDQFQQQQQQQESDENEESNGENGGESCDSNGNNGDSSQSQQNSSDSDSDSDSNDDSNGNSNESDQDNSDDDSNQNKSNGGNNQETDDKSNKQYNNSSGNDKSDSKNSPNNTGAQPKPDDLYDSKTQDAMHGNLQNSASSNDNIVYGAFDECNYINNNVIDSFTDRFIKGFEDSQNYYSYSQRYTVKPAIKKMLQPLYKAAETLSAEFQIKKASKSTMLQTGFDTGELDMNKLDKCGFSEDIFLNLTEAYDGDKYCLTVLLDCSGSMYDDVRKSDQLKNLIDVSARKAVILAMFCRMCAIPFKILGFTTKNRGVQGCHIFTLLQDQKNDRLFEKNCVALLAYAEHEHTLDSGCTPLIQALAECRPYMVNFKEQCKADRMTLIVLNDGGPNYYHHEDVLYDKITGLQIMPGDFEDVTTNILNFAFKIIKKCIDNLTIVNCIEYSNYYNNSPKDILSEWGDYCKTLTNNKGFTKDSVKKFSSTLSAFGLGDDSVDKVMLYDENYEDGNSAEHQSIVRRKKSLNVFVTEFIDTFI